jgi:hypothetical protein
MSLCDLLDKLLPVTKIPDTFVTPPEVTKPAAKIFVTPHFKKGRPTLSVTSPCPPAERQRLSRARKAPE